MDLVDGLEMHQLLQKINRVLPEMIVCYGDGLLNLHLFVKKSSYDEALCVSMS